MKLKSISQLKEDGWPKNLLMRIAHSEFADRYCFKTTENQGGKYMFDVDALVRDRKHLMEIK